MQSPKMAEPFDVQSGSSVGQTPPRGQQGQQAPPRTSMGSSASRETVGTGTVSQDMGVGCHPSSFLQPTGISARKPPPKAVGPFVELFVFFMFVLLRAVHPVIIDESKVNGEYPYSMESTVVFMTTLLALLSLSVCYAHGGREQFETIWQIRPMMVFSINGIVYALGDYLEMASMSEMNGAAYQILMQSRILVTAALMTFAKGAYQTRLQWTLLFILVSAMSTYMVLTTGEDDISALPVYGMTMACLKVFISCFGAVLSDKYMKVYRDDPMHVQIARIYIARAVTIIILSFFGESWTKGFFAGWNYMTVCVTLSFIVKSISSLYIVALLDSILKNIAESVAVLVIYAYKILAPWSHEEFDISTFLAILVIVSACGAYIDSKSPVDKAKKWDRHLQKNARYGRRPTTETLPQSSPRSSPA